MKNSSQLDARFRVVPSHLLETVAKLERRATYAAQRSYVAMMFEVLGRLLEASSKSDPDMAAELLGFPDGCTIAFSVLGEDLEMRLRVEKLRFVRVTSRKDRADLHMVFKHISHAFYVLTFQERAAQAFANARTVTHGDTSLIIRFVRCLNRAQAIALPPLVAERALKEPLPTFGSRERITLTVKLLGRLAQGLFGRSAA